MKEITSELKDLVDEISSYNEVEAIYLFGSQISGRARKDSDIDIAVILKSRNSEKEFEIIGLGNEKFDVSIFSRLPLIIQARVLREGELLFCRDKEFLFNLQKEILKYYLDYSSFINRFNRRVLNA